MSDDSMPVTRRRFLELVGAAGGAAAVYESMVALGLMAVPEAYAGPPDVSGAPGAGKRVIVLGAGVAGLTAAWRLQQAGCQVAVFEALDRLGGRNFTVSTAGTDRRDVIRQNGLPDQPCKFTGDPNRQFFEAGPGRLPYHHLAVLELCQQLGVALEPYVMETRSNRFQTDAAFDRQPVDNRRVANDTRGYIAELLAKAINTKALDAQLSAADRGKLLSLLGTFGDISPTSNPPYTYYGSTRSGYLREPGVTSPGVQPPPLTLDALLQSEFWKHRFYQPEDYPWQATLFHPVGGMRRIVDALAAKVGAHNIRRGVAAKHIVNGDDRVSVELSDGTTVVGDYCISTIPLPLLTPLLEQKTFSKDFLDAVGAVPFAATCKVGWQAKSRFWERLKNPDGTNGPQIFGGISWIDHPITQLWYTSADYFAPGPAILTGCYNYDSPGKPVATDFGKLPLAQRLEVALQGGERLHREFREYVPAAAGLSIAWQQVPHMSGGWAEWKRDDPQHVAAYQRLLRADRRFMVSGDQVSYLPGWQEGAVLSAYHVVGLITGRPTLSTQATEAAPTTAPDSAAVTGAG